MRRATSQCNIRDETGEREATYRLDRSDVGVQVKVLAEGDDGGRVASNLVGRRAA